MNKTTLTWVAQSILCLGFLFFGIMKFVTSPQDGAEVFGNIGGTMSQYFTGVYEVVSGILIIIPATALIGAILIIISMVVALVLHVTVLEVSIPLMLIAVVFIAIAIYVLLQRKNDAFWSN